ncbi:MAG: proton-conducting membrane transporter [Clostridiales bacterium]|nr:proton-conducting membrane transporter [Clostridiales bacterium]
MLVLAMTLPLIAGVLLLFIKPRSAAFRGWYVMLSALGTSALAAWVIFTPGDHAFTLLRLTEELTISFRLDGLGRIFAGLAALLWPMVSLYALEYMEHESGENTFFGWFLMAYAATLGISFSEDLMSLFVFYEMLTLSTLPLVMQGMRTQRVHAGRKYLYYSMGGTALAFLALVTVAEYGGGNFILGGNPALGEAPLSLLLPMFVLGFFGFGVKAAVFPLHGWLPTAGVAPTPVTALLHAVAVVKAGAFAVIRLGYYCYAPSMVAGTWAQYVCLGAAILTILIGSAVALRERHLKRRFAYSTMSNLSYVLFGAMLLSPAGLEASLVHLIFHALMKIVLFLCIGAVMIKAHGRFVHDLRGLGRRMPVVSAVFLLGALSLTGIPPLPGFQSKWLLAEAGIQGGVMGMIGTCVLIISAVLTAMYALVPALSLYRGDSAEPAEKAEPGWRMLVCLILLAVILLAVTFLSDWMVSAIHGEFAFTL